MSYRLKVMREFKRVVEDFKTVIASVHRSRIVDINSKPFCMFCKRKARKVTFPVTGQIENNLGQGASLSFHYHFGD